VLSYLSSGAAHLLRVPQVVEAMTHLGYPAHFVITMGIWKVMGGAGRLILVQLVLAALVVASWARFAPSAALKRA